MTDRQHTTAGEVTRLLKAWRAGDPDAANALLDLVYLELKGVAARRLARLGAPVIDPTELVNEAVLRLLGQPLDAQNRQHFFKIAATAIRYALVDIVRRQHASKRGGGAIAITLSQAEPVSAAGEQWLEVEQALSALDRHDPRKCRVVELAWLVGLRQQEIAHTLGVSLTTIERDLRFAKAWLREQLSPSPRPKARVSGSSSTR